VAALRPGDDTTVTGLSAVGVTVTAMRLEMMTAGDVELRLRTETDPVMMAELGGPRPPEDIKRAHARALVMAAEGRCWPLKVIPDGSASAAGSVAVFESSHEGETIYEIGWMVLPEFQGRGIASQAVRTVLDKARAERKFGRIHAFPAVTNGPSNKICEKNGFANLGECEVGFAGRTLRCCHWRIDLF
jgi:RimJ/RimL family protein N-acetyltransferase